MSKHPAAIVFDQVVEQVDQYAKHATTAERAEFWTIFAARTMGLLAAQIGQEAFAEFIAGTNESAQELFATDSRTH